MLESKTAQTPIGRFRKMLLLLNGIKCKKPSAYNFRHQVVVVFRFGYKKRGALKILRCTKKIEMACVML